MKTYLSIICLIVLCGCQSYNRLSGGGFYTQSNQTLKETEKIEDVSFQEHEEVVFEKINEDTNTFNLFESKNEFINTISPKKNKKNSMFLTNESFLKSYSEKGINSDYKQVTEDVSQKRKIEPMGLIGFIFSSLSLISIIVLLLLTLVSGIGTAYPLVIVTICVALIAFILGLVSFLITKKKPHLYRMHWFSKVAMYFSGIIIGVGLIIIPIASFIVNLNELSEW